MTELPSVPALAPRASADDLDDLKLVIAAKDGDERAASILVRRYRPLIIRLASNYFVPGGAREDVIGEGMLGFARALADFDASYGTPFRSFAKTCVERQIITAVKTSTRLKHQPLNESRPLHAPLARHRTSAGPGALNLEDVIGGRNTESEVLILDDLRQVKTTIDTGLSRNEQIAAVGTAVGVSYVQMATAIGSPTKLKAVDNALQRARRKIALRLKEDAA
ncbi:MAG: sigma-70 family RNA polymerase sigma factor [Solirubrobacterales bacterium]|nr:sigma-70 family RNA polymerase sigma factor [Solirubrobacterales bacterium]